MLSEQEADICEQEQTAATVFERMADLLPLEDLTASARNGILPEAVTLQKGAAGETSDQRDRYEVLARALYRRTHNHVLITGDKGVGKTTVVRELARRAATGEIDFLKSKRFVWIDCSPVTPEDSRAFLEALFSQCPQHADLVICLDGLAGVLERPQGGDNKQLLRSLLRQPRVQLIGVMSRWEYNELIAGDAELLELFTRVEIEEPHEQETLAIVRQAAEQLEREYQMKLPTAVVERTIMLTSNFILNQCQPAKSITVLRQVCDSFDYARTQQKSDRQEIDAAEVVCEVAEITGIPAATLAGETGDADFEAAITESVVGQERAVNAVANELQLIKAGLTDPGKPASVLLFSGMTGVGKTELAKRIAELYSSSKRLQTYTMGNFTEPHSVSGIIGVPPGYVGHEQGGRLINELNADPYSVFLLDEAEKSHPNVWKPFLNLFDEGWIEDQRGTKAYADRAIFILTTNAGDRAIAQMTKSGKPEEEILEHVKTSLGRIRHERSSQPVFTPQFLSRMKRIIVFAPLDEQAMIEIADKMVRQIKNLWRQKREKEIVVREELVQKIGREAHSRNEQAGGQEGGRIVRKLISDLVESRIQQESSTRQSEYQACQKIVLELEDTATDVDQDASQETRLPAFTIQFA